MKNLLGIILLGFILGSCDPSPTGHRPVNSKCDRPHDIPEWVEWDCDKQDAYDEGAIYFNEDSTAFAYGHGDTLDEETIEKVQEKINNLDFETDD